MLRNFTSVFGLIKEVCFVIFLLSTGIIINVPVSSSESASSCNNPQLLIEVKRYLERVDVQIAMLKWDKSRRRSPQTVWERVQKMGNLCESEEAEFIRVYCGHLNILNMSSPLSLDWPWPSRKSGDENSTPHLDSWNLLTLQFTKVQQEMGEDDHFCSRVPGLPLPSVGNELTLWAEKADKLIGNVLKKSSTNLYFPQNEKTSEDEERTNQVFLDLLGLGQISENQLEVMRKMFTDEVFCYATLVYC